MASSSLKLTAPIPMGVLGGMGSNGNHPEASSMEPRQAPRMISASSSVVSSNSISSSSTKASSVPRINANMGVLTGESDAIKNLMCESSAAPPEAKEEDAQNGVPARGASVVPGGQVIKSDSPSSSSLSAPAAPSSSEGGNPMVLHMGAPPHPVAEFLFQLTKMLTDNNLEYIEWRNASIFVHDPPGLEKDILPKYFRHSNYSSFQRQMNYFGFRKIAGKGKMAPCSYVNEHAKEDISSLLFIKRKKTGVSSAAAKLMAQQNRISRTMASSGMAMNSLGGNQSLMMGGAMGGMLGVGGLPGATVDPSHVQNHFSMMGGMGAAAGAGNMIAGAGSLNDQASLLREQQNMLAQLQQAHASALTNSAPMGMGGSGQGSIPQAAQNKFNGLGMSNVGPNTGVLANDQGSLYMGATSNNPNDWSNHTTNAATAHLIQQATSSLGGGIFPNAGAGDSNKVLRVDSAANLRALINQQISMFNTGSADPCSTSAMSNAGMVQQQGPCSQQAAANGFPAAMGNPASQTASGVSYDWNEILQRSGGMENANAPVGAAMSGADMASLRQLEQQLIHQNGNAGAPGPSAAAPMGQSYNFNGLFGQGGMSGGSQGL